MSQSIQEAFSQMFKSSNKRKASTTVGDSELLGRGSRPLGSADLQASPTAPQSPVRKKSRQDITAAPSALGIALSSQKASGKAVAGGTGGKSSTTLTMPLASKFGSRMPLNSAPSFGKATASTKIKPVLSSALGDPFSLTANSQSGNLFGKQQDQGRASIVVTPDIAPGFAAMQLEGEPYRNLGIDPTDYDETFDPALLDTTPRAKVQRRSSRNDLDVIAKVLEAVESITQLQKEDKKERKKTNALLETLTERVEKVEESIKDFTTGGIAAIQAEVATIRSDVQSLKLGSTAKTEGGGKSQTDEPMTKLVKTYRAAMYQAMGISDGSLLPAPLTDEDLEDNPGSSEYYLVIKSDDDEASESTVLRPNFNIALGKQTTWHKSLITIIKTKGDAIGDITKDLLLSFNDADHKAALQRCFKSLKTAYQFQQKADDHKEQRRKAGRRRNRRFTLAEDRKDVRLTSYIPALLREPEWNFLFDPGYTSEQLSADEDAANANPELVAKLEKGGKFYMTLSPAYQKAEVTRIKHELVDHAVELHQAEKLAKQKGPTKGAKKIPTAYDRRLYEKELPSGRKLPFFALDATWAGEHGGESLFVDPHLGTTDDDVDELALNGTAESERDRETRARIYQESLQLLEDYKPDAAGGLLDRLALSANCSGAEGLSGDSEDVEMEGRGAWSTSESEGVVSNGHGGDENSDEE